MSSETTHKRVPELQDVERIVALSDPVIRNLQITQCYHELSAALAARTGLCANWCTFATWASKQAGQTIRKDDAEDVLENVLNSAPVVTDAVEQLVRVLRRIGATHGADKIREIIRESLGMVSPLNRTSEAIARGNKKVFEEVGREFARFSSICLADQASDAAKIERFCQEFRAGDPPEGQDYLRRAFARYYQSLFEDDPKRRAELLFLANIEIGFHEQTRLQPEIREALDSAVPDPAEFKRRLLSSLFPGRGWLIRLRQFFMRLIGRATPLDRASEALLTAVRHQARLVITEHLLTINLPHGERLRLGEDLSAKFPDTLGEIVNDELRTFLERVDPTLDSVAQSGATDWAALPERMHYITDLFRCYQEVRDLLEPPFTPEQVAALRSGRLPKGKL